MNSNALIVHYPSVLTTYYATGQWHKEYKDKNHREKNARFAIIDYGEPTEQLIYNGRKIKNTCMTFFHADASQCPDPHVNPSSIEADYWLQASIPKNLYNRLLYITNNSGKFLVFIPFDKIDATWKKFNEAYQQGLLGYGLQCATRLDNPHAHDNHIKVILVHTEDAFDLEETARVAWQIDKLLGNWEGFLKYLTDRSIQARASLVNMPDPDTLYSISSRSFINDAINGGKDKKSLSHFTKTFQGRFTQAAQQCQDALKNENWKKFISKTPF